MKVEVGAPVVLLAGDPGVWHVPAAARVWMPRADREYAHQIPLARALERLNTVNWPTLCERRGDIFIYRGVIRRRGVCTACAAAAPALLPAVEPLPVPEYDDVGVRRLVAV